MRFTFVNAVLGAVVLIVVLWLLFEVADSTRRMFRRWRTRRFLRVHAGGRRTVFTSYGDLVERKPRPPVPSLRRPGDNDAA